MSLPETYKAIVADDQGQPISKDFPLPKPSTNQVIVKIAFAPINPTDFLRLKGAYKPLGGYSSPLIGSEGSGTVVAVGDDLKVSHKVGDRVHVRNGTWGQYLVTDSEQVFPILHHDLSLEDAASHYVNPATVHYMGDLTIKGGHKAAIHTVGASALGKMLIRYYKHKGIKLINIVRKEEQIEELKQIGADYVLNSQAPDFEAKLKELAEKESATIAFDAIAGDFTAKVLTCQPAKSDIYAYGALSGSLIISGINIMELMKERDVKGLFLPNYIKDLTQNGRVGEVMKEVHSLLPTVLKTHIHKVYEIKDLSEAIEDYNKNSSKGKVLLKIN